MVVSDKSAGRETEADEAARVLIVALGGTIASGQTADTAGVSPSLSVEQIVDAVPDLARFAEVSTLNFETLPGPEITAATVVQLVAEIRKQSENEGVGGFVVTQGTDTIEETAYLLDLLAPAGVAIVVTGAMRHPKMAGADGPANLLAAVQVAASGKTKDVGAVVVLNDQIHAARFVHKSHTTNPATFISPLTGPVGWISEGQVRVALRPRAVELSKLPREVHPGRVALIKICMDDGPAMVPAVQAAGYQGLVVEGMGGGHVRAAFAEPLGALATEIPVVIASRAGSGQTLQNTYGSIGGEIDLIERGLLPAGILDGVKAKLAVSVLLGAHDYGDRFRTEFKRLSLPVW